MPPKPKSLTEKEVKQIRESPNYQKIARTLGISKNRARAIQIAPTLEEALEVARPQSKTLTKSKSAKSNREGTVVGRLDEAALKPSAPTSTPTPLLTPEGAQSLPVSEPSQGQKVEAKSRVQERDNTFYPTLIPEEVVGRGIPFQVTLSVKTLAYYQIASTMNPSLSLGDFLDDCVDDTFRGRGLSLGLIKTAG